MSAPHAPWPVHREKRAGTPPACYRRRVDDAPDHPADATAPGVPGLVSVVTATHDPRAPYLREAYESLLLQRSTPWEWLVQFDGNAWQPPSWMGADPRIRFEANGARLGIALTRNLALGRARGALVQSLDSDDALLPGALARLAGALTDDPRLAYAVGRIHFLVDGRITDAYDHDVAESPAPPPGRFEPRALYDLWRANGDDLHSLFNFPMWRRDALLAYGGWAALSTGEDFNVLFAVAEDHPGELVDAVTLVYRQHPGSVMHDASYWRASPRNKRFTIARLTAMRALRARSEASSDA